MMLVVVVCLNWDFWDWVDFWDFVLAARFVFLWFPAFAGMAWGCGGMMGVHYPSVSGRVCMSTGGGFVFVPPPAPFQGRRVGIIFWFSVTSPSDVT